jgi:selenide,water dikinase
LGLLGHAWVLAVRAQARLSLSAAALPLYPGAEAAAAAGTRTGGDARNRSHLEGRVRSSASAALEALAYDPQTSGGLLAAVPPAHARHLESASDFVTIGEVVAGPAGVSLG